MTPIKPQCRDCGRVPAEIAEYADLVLDGSSVDDFVRWNDGTYNPETGHFLCTRCILMLGCLFCLAGGARHD